MRTAILLLWATILIAEARPPNLVLIFCDDLGYGDLSCYGGEGQATPAIDSIARDGIRFTDFYSSSPVCTPSRASLLTGCYAQRVGMEKDFTGHWVLIPRSKRGLDPEEVTFPEALKDKGYATACIGKWHLGDQPEHLPTRHGFDRYFGIPYSNDMAHAPRGDPPLPLLNNEKVIDAPVDQATLTRRYTEQAISFIESNKEKPFFLYLPHTFPHLPLFATEPFLKKSANGKYGATVLEIDDSTDMILNALDRLGLADDTLVIFTSDNGSNGRNGGSNKPLSGAKGSTMEGGMRIPFVARWPGKIPAGSTCSELAVTFDLFPTFLGIVDGKPWASKRPIDGRDIWPLLSGHPGATTPHAEFLYYRRSQLQAVRSGDWKYHLPLERTHPNWTSPKNPGKGRPGKLVNLRDDLQEKIDVAEKHPAVVEKMSAIAAGARKKLGTPEGLGAEQRTPTDVENPTPRVLEAKRAAR